jgi:uncharacterized protein DUF4439
VKPIQALQATLAAEHAAVYVYGVLGGRVSVAENPRTATLLRSAYDTHRARRDRLRTVIADLGRTPVATEEGYAVDAEDRSATHLARVALLTEQRCAAVYSQLVASTVGGQRRWAVDALTDASLRALTFGGDAETWPGAPEF